MSSNYPVTPTFNPNCFTEETARAAILAAEACIQVASARSTPDRFRYPFSVWEVVYIARGGHALDWMASEGMPVESAALDALGDEFLTDATIASDRLWLELESGGVALAAYAAVTGQDEADPGLEDRMHGDDDWFKRVWGDTPE